MVLKKMKIMPVYVETCWEMRLQDGSIGELVENAYRVVKVLWEMPNYKWRPAGRISCLDSRSSLWLREDENPQKASSQ
jgi:hypothetical protein